MNALPKRIQRQRTKGWAMPPGAIYVGRPSRWGNSWAHGRLSTRVAIFRDEVLNWNHDYRMRWLAPLRGHDLACWCPLEDADGNRVPCHADVLLALANEPADLGGEK